MQFIPCMQPARAIAHLIHDSPQVPLQLSVLLQGVKEGRQSSTLHRVFVVVTTCVTRQANAQNQKTCVL